MKAIVTVMAIVVIIIGISFFQPVGLNAKIGVLWIQGEAWKKFDEAQRIIYLAGVLDGYLIGKEQRVELSYETSLNHLMGALNSFYSDYKNELIPVPFALMVITSELNGDTKAELDEFKEFMRKRFKKTQ